jgi:hypothetical protein
MQAKRRYAAVARRYAAVARVYIGTAINIMNMLIILKTK